MKTSFPPEVVVSVVSVTDLKPMPRSSKFFTDFEGRKPYVRDPLIPG